jgi:hypothetical protein
VLYRGGIALVVLVSACQFRPEGGELGDDDDVLPVGDAAVEDATPIDAPVSPTDAPMATVDAAIDARPACPAAYTTVAAGMRYVRRGPAGIDLARADCNDDLPGRTRLATFPVEETMEQVFEELLDSSDQPWVGARCTFGTFGCAGASSWRWDTGEALDEELWGQNEPNNAFTELNAAAARVGGDWALFSVDGIFPLEGRRYACACSE